jgi:hypothetical protein
LAITEGEQLLARSQQVFPVAGLFGSQVRVVAGDQPLAGEVVGGDLGPSVFSLKAQTPYCQPSLLW